VTRQAKQTPPNSTAYPTSSAKINYTSNPTDPPKNRITDNSLTPPNSPIQHTQLIRQNRITDNSLTRQSKLNQNSNQTAITKSLSQTKITSFVA